MFVHIKAFHKIACKTSLVEMDIKGILRDIPGEVDAQKPLNDSHQFDWDQFRKDGLEIDFNIVVSKENKVNNIEIKNDRNQGVSIRRVGRVVNTARVETRIVGIRKETHVVEITIHLVVPVVLATT